MSHIPQLIHLFSRSSTILFAAKYYTLDFLTRSILRERDWSCHSASRWQDLRVRDLLSNFSEFKVASHTGEMISQQSASHLLSSHLHLHHLLSTPSYLILQFSTPSPYPHYSCLPPSPYPHYRCLPPHTPCCRICPLTPLLQSSTPHTPLLQAEWYRGIKLLVVLCAWRQDHLRASCGDFLSFLF